jgi:UDP-N-acetylmuramate dehydrogenase
LKGRRETSMAVAEVKRLLEGRFGGAMRQDASLADFTTFRIGGPAGLLLFPKGLEDLIMLGKAVAETGAEFLVLGRGSNVLVSDQGFPGVIAVLGKGLGRIKIKGKDEIDVEAGCELNRLISHCIEEGLGGLEHLAGIPGTLGGAVRMNAGALGASIGERVETVSVLRLEGGEIKSRELTASGVNFRYRETDIGDNEIIYKVKLRLYEEEKAKLKLNRKEALEWRKKRQPLRQPSAGSVFRNPEGVSAGELIERCGLKGMRAGNAVISEKHANFIVNLGGARAADVYELIRVVKEKVLEEEGIELREEIKFVGGRGDEG